VAVDVRQERPRRQRAAIDPIEAGAGHLDELQSLRGRAHLAGERESDQHVDVGQLRDDPGLVGQDDVARHPQARSYRWFEGRGEGAGEGDLKYGHRSSCVHPPRDSAGDQLPGR